MGEFRMHADGTRGAAGPCARVQYAPRGVLLIVRYVVMHHQLVAVVCASTA